MNIVVRTFLSRRTFRQDIRQAKIPTTTRNCTIPPAALILKHERGDFPINVPFPPQADACRQRLPLLTKPLYADIVFDRPARSRLYLACPPNSRPQMPSATRPRRLRPRRQRHRRLRRTDGHETPDVPSDLLAFLDDEALPHRFVAEADALMADYYCSALGDRCLQARSPRGSAPIVHSVQRFCRSHPRSRIARTAHGKLDKKQPPFSKGSAKRATPSSSAGSPSSAQCSTA